MKTYKVQIENEVYEVKIEEVTEGSVTTTAKAEPAAPAAPAPAPTAPAAAPVEEVPAPTPAPAPSADATTITAPIPGTIISVNVKEGDTVTKGQTLIILEAMKLENEIVSTVDGTVTGIHTGYDQIVNAGDPLITIG